MNQDKQEKKKIFGGVKIFHLLLQLIIYLTENSLANFINIKKYKKKI